MGNKKGCFFELLRRLDRGMATIQIKCRFDRREKDITYKKGGNWVSITRKCAEYVVSKEKWFEENFRMTLCGDEVFLQTLIWNSPFSKNIYDGRFQSLRYVDWKRGNPYTFQYEDMEELLNAPYDALFARKFSEEKDNRIIKELYEVVNKQRNL